MIFLIGFMGTGKSAVSHELQKLLQLPVMEMDEELVRRAGKSIPQIFAENGEQAFRDQESALLKELSESDTDYIVSCGGGVVLREENRAILRKYKSTVLLTATPETVLMRAGGDENRPLLKDALSASDIAARMEARSTFYKECAGITVATDGKTPENIAHEIVTNL